MEKAKASVGDFLHRSGKHDTTVNERVEPAVVHETVKPHEHEKVTSAVDREVHQDHHHTTVQPVTDQHVREEQHHHNVSPVETRQYNHGSDEQTSAKLEQERGQFQHKTATENTTSSSETNPVVVGEHKHHNVHEVIQPVVHRETVEPHVVHTVAQVHERHDNPAEVHSTNSLPPMNMSEFANQGGVLNGRETRTDHFEGEPRPIGGGHHTGHELPSSNTRGTETTTGATQGTSALPHTTTGGTHGTSATPHTTTSTTGTSSAPKPSLIDKLNPKKDADGDGKAGIMK